jgi:putative ABC transport system substrate-binding protein
MKRREFLSGLGGAAAAWPSIAQSQQSGRMQRVVVLIGLAEDDPIAKSRVAAFQQGFQALGWMDGRNVQIDYRFAGDDPGRVTSNVSEMVRSAPDVIMAQSTPILMALRKATRSIPVVFVQISDPVSSGLVTSLAQPGANFTGFTGFEDTMGAKWLEALKEIAPHLTRVAAIENPGYVSSAGYLRSMETAASFGVRLTRAGVRNAAEIKQSIDAFSQEANGGLIVLPDITTATHRELIIELAAKYRLPAIYAFRYLAEGGGLMSYGADQNDMYRRSASYVDRILRGTKPADLPVQQPTKFELVINLKAAKALYLTIPPTMLARADEVIE